MGASKPSRNLIVGFAGVVMLLQLACGTSSSATSRAAAGRLSNELVGSWDARFELQNQLRPTSLQPPSVRGSLTFVRTSSGALNPVDLAAPVIYGLYDADFSSFGFDTHDGEDAPTAVAGIAGVSTDSTDSVLIVIGAKGRGICVILRGRLDDGKVNGTWTTESGRAGIAEWGHFSLTRRRRGDVQVERDLNRRAFD